MTVVKEPISYLPLTCYQFQCYKRVNDEEALPISQCPWLHTSGGTHGTCIQEKENKPLIIMSRSTRKKRFTNSES